MDHEEEQQMELEALRAILGDEGVVEYTGQVPSGWTEARPIYKVQVSPDTDEDDLDLRFELLFQHTDTYPETAPCLKVSNTRGMTDADAGALTAVISDTAEENLGMASIFAVVQAAKEWLEDKAGCGEVVDPAVLKKQQEEAEERARLEARSHGTPVTPESFAAWRAKFDAEVAAAREAEGATAKDVEQEGKKTGKEWFTEKDRPEEPENEDLDIESDDEGEEGGDGADTDFDFDDDDDDEEFLDDYLATADDS